MREDMDKVIVERPRYGSRARSHKKGYRKQRQKSELADLPKREPMPGRWRGMGKCFNEHLGPMRRFLRSRVGRPWDKVYQELREHVSFDNVVQKHVLTHVNDFVHRHVDIVDGKPTIKPGAEWSRTLRVGDMYVCPRSGLLNVVRSPRQNSNSPQIVHFEPMVQYHWRDNAWWEVRLRKPPDDPGDLWDAWLERPVRVGGGWTAFGGKLMAISKRPLSPREARELHRRLRKARRP
jgi:hypothetical protein